MAYYVYESRRNDRVRVHRGECSHCNEGRGTQRGASDDNGWVAQTASHK